MGNEHHIHALELLERSIDDRAVLVELIDIQLCPLHRGPADLQIAGDKR